MLMQIIAAGASISARFLLAGERASLVGRNLGPAIAGFCRTGVRQMINPYRPELHYMRGPGPKWREQHVRVRRRD